MSKAKGTAVQPLTGNIVNGVQPSKKPARPTRKVSNQTPPAEGEVMTLQDFANAEFDSIVQFEGTRMARWVGYIRAFYQVGGDFDRFANAVKSKMLESIGVKPGSAVKTWSDEARSIYKSRFEQHISAMHRVEYALTQIGKDAVIGILEAKNLAHVKIAKGESVSDSDGAIPINYAKKLAALPKSSTRGRKAGSTNKNVKPKVTVPDETSTHSDAEKQPEPVAAPRSVAEIQKQARDTGAATLAAGVAAVHLEYFNIVAAAFATRCKTMSGWEEIGKSIFDKLESIKPASAKKKAA